MKALGGGRQEGPMKAERELRGVCPSEADWGREMPLLSNFVVLVPEKCLWN